MSRLLFSLGLLFLAACSDNKKASEEGKVYTYTEFAESFRKASQPFTLTDTGFLKNTDTASIRDKNFIALLQVNVLNEIFGKGAKLKFIPLWKIEGSAEEEYFIIKVQTNKKKAAVLVVFDKDHQSKAGFSFLVPDEDPVTMQTSSIDRSYSISKSIVKKNKDGITSEGKDVYVYNKASQNFTLVMTDPLDERELELVNPIDTLSKKHKLAGDYVKDKRNIVSIRDGRKPNLLTVFVHIERGTDCTGEIKGDATISSATTAVYQQAGDPCLLQLTFSGSTVRLTELEGCGSRRGLDCKFDGSFTRKKQPTAKATKSKVKSSKR
jgi:hypothetical protein